MFFFYQVVVQADERAEDIIFSDSHFKFGFYNDEYIHFGVYRIWGYSFGKLNLTEVSTALSATRIHYYAMTYSKQAMELFLDGELVHTQATTGPMFHTDTSIYIGGADDHKHKNITLYMMKISNRVKTAEEIANFASCELNLVLFVFFA